MEDTTTTNNPINVNGGTKIRYGVTYNDRNYERALHSEKRHFLRNLADVLNVIEYCVVQDFKKNGYVLDNRYYNVDVRRLINDQVDEKFEQRKDFEIEPMLHKIVDQMIEDTLARKN